MESPKNIQIDTAKVVITHPVLIKEGCLRFCIKCGSSAERKIFWNPFSKILCINKYCEYSNKKINHERTKKQVL